MNKEDQIVQSAIQSYSRLVREYMNKCDDMVGKLGSEPDDMRYVINMGSRVVGHIFNLVISTSLCVETASKLARNGIYYYLEFIGQIGEDDHQYLKLTPKDAVVFVYKKTIDTISSRPSISDDVVSPHGLDIIFSCTHLLSQSGTIFRDSQKGVNLSELVAFCLKAVQHNDVHLLPNLQWTSNFLSLVKDEDNLDIIYCIIKKTLNGTTPYPTPHIVMTRLHNTDLNGTDNINRVVNSLLAAC